MSNVLGSNAIRSILGIVIGLLVIDLGTWATTDIDWRPTVAKYAIAVLTAIATTLGVATKGRGRLV